MAEILSLISEVVSSLGSILVCKVATRPVSIESRRVFFSETVDFFHLALHRQKQNTHPGSQQMEKNRTVFFCKRKKCCRADHTHQKEKTKEVLSLLYICLRFASPFITEEDLRTIPVDLHELLQRRMGKHQQIRLFSEWNGWHEDGWLLWHEPHRNGKMHGECKEWHDNGQLRRHRFFENGELHGECKEWRDNGQLWWHRHYKNGCLHGECWDWHDNGRLWRHRHYKDGCECGEFREWYDTGILKKREHYEDGKKVGVTRWWHPNGQLWVYDPHKDGRRHGDYKIWDNTNNGLLCLHERYEDGVCVKDCLKNNNNAMKKKGV